MPQLTDAQKKDKKAAAEEWAKLKVTRDQGLPDTQGMDQDINLMHRKFGVHPVMDAMSPELLKKFLEFRFGFLQEEVDEGIKAIAEKDPDNVVDSLIDLVVVALGTLDLYGVRTDEAWYKVQVANMAKEAGYNPSRPNEFGAPDLIKPTGWTAPSHEGNYGLIERALVDQNDLVLPA